MEIALLTFAALMLFLIVAGLTMHVRDILHDREEERRMEAIRQTLETRKRIMGY